MPTVFAFLFQAETENLWRQSFVSRKVSQGRGTTRQHVARFSKTQCFLGFGGVFQAETPFWLEAFQPETATSSGWRDFNGSPNER